MSTPVRLLESLPALSGNQKKFITGLHRKKNRLTRGCYLVEGQRLLLAALKSRVTLRTVVLCPGLIRHLPDEIRLLLRRRSIPVFHTDENTFRTLADTESPAGFLAVATLPPFHEARDLSPAPLLYLDSLRDPGNCGTLLRTAAWLGWKQVVAGPGTADLFQPKVVRGGMGAHFELEFYQLPPDQLGRPYYFLAADQRGEPIHTLSLPAGSIPVLALGNEAHGLTETVRKRADIFVSIPGTEKVESLNVAAAGSILLWELSRRIFNQGSDCE